MENTFEWYIYFEMRPSRFFFIIILLFASAIRVHAQEQTLDYYLQAAENKSPLLNDYNNQLYSLQLDSLKLKADYGFVVSGEGAATYAPAIKGWGYDEALTNGQSLGAGVRASKTLVSKNNLNTRLATFYVNRQQVSNRAKLTLLQLKKNIADAYAATYISQLQYLAAQDIIHLLDQEDVVLKKLTQSSVFKQTDYLSFKVTLQQNQLNLEQRKAEWYNNFASLNYAAGIIDTVPKNLLLPYADSITEIPFEESVYAESFRLDSMKLVNDAAILKYDYKPKISAYADGGYQSSFIQQPYKNFGWSTGITVSIPIYDGKKKQLSVQQNQVAQQSREKYSEFAKTQYRQQIAQIKSQLAQYKKMVDMANEQMKYSQTLIEANARQLPTGDVRMVDFILSINNYLDLKAGLLQYQSTIFNLQNQLHYLIIQ